LDKRVGIFIIIAFGISWLTALVIYLTGGLVDSRELISGTGITVAIVLLSTLYMWGPAAANLLTRRVTGQGWQNMMLRPAIKKNWKYWLVAWFGTAGLTLVGTVIYFLLFPNHFDPSLSVLKDQMEAAGVLTENINLSAIILIQTAAAIFYAPVLNALPTFGEEFGWRAYLLPQLAEFGKRKALLLSGVFWGIWHWPVILMGHNYGLEYIGYPFTGLAVMVWFTLTVGIFFGWLSHKSGSVWPAVIAHGALNGIAGIGLLFVRSGFSPLLGPSPAGLVGGIPFTIAAALILLLAKEDENVLSAD